VRSVEVLKKSGAIAERLSFTLGMMTLMVVLGPNGPTVLRIFGGSSRLNVNIRQGTLYSVTGTASGRVFAAFERAKVADLISRELDGNATSRSVGEVPTPEVFEAAVGLVKHRGVAEAIDAPIPGVSAVAAPVFDDNGVAAVLTVLGRSEDMRLDTDSTAANRLLEAVAEVSERSGAKQALVIGELVRQ
jgi:DNA-binding IclR family transcriptional regulator